jgi:hypothetical protein
MKTRVYASLALLALVSVGAAEASTIMIPSLEPTSPRPYASDPYFGASTGDALAPFTGTGSVDFVGFHHLDLGGSAETLNGAHLGFRYRLTFTDPVDVLTVAVAGFGDYSAGNSVLRLLDSRGKVIVSQPLTGLNLNSVNTLTLKAGAARGQVFILEEYTDSWDSNFVSSVRVTSNSLTSQCSK